MSNCEFVNTLNRLRKSSNDSIDNISAFDDFKKYMHVPRTAEEDLKKLLRQINLSKKKTLILLCGSAGDGKSHLLSYLRNSDEENLLADYYVYNDATESESPTLTAIETLNKVLSGFSDSMLDEPGQNLILAINLGVLSNFIESKYGESFTMLKSYVEKSHILTVQVNNSSYNPSSHFQHVSFSDYHLYSLSENGISTSFISKLFDKVFSENQENIFYTAHCEKCSNCPLNTKCPVKSNYKFLLNTENRTYISNLLVKTIIKKKVVLTTREILNFIFDIVVSHDFNYPKFQKILDDSEFVKEFIKCTTPSLLFESNDVSALLNIMQNFDPLFDRDEKADEEAVSYYVSSDVTDIVRTKLKGTPYSNIICKDSIISRVNEDRQLKTLLFSFLIRQSNYSLTDKDYVYALYLKNLYFFNAGKGKKLASLYSMVEDAVVQWCGKDDDENLCVDDNHKGFTLYEDIEFIPNLDHISSDTSSDILERFVPVITITYEDKNASRISLVIDYSLFELIQKLNKGYIQTANDRNNFADFIGFIKKIKLTGSMSEKMYVVTESGKKASITKSKFGYKFKAVK